MSAAVGLTQPSAWRVQPIERAEPTALHVRLIGAMDAVTADGLSVLPRTRKARALLAILAMAAPQKVARSTVAALLWSRRGREQARGSLRQALLDLQGSLLSGGIGRLHASREHLALSAEALTTDLPQPGDPAGRRLLEDLRGLDPAFDLWIADRIAALSLRLPPVPFIETLATRSTTRRPRLGVMPLRATDGDRTAAVGRGIAGELTSALSRFSWMVLPCILDLSAAGPLQRDDARALGVDFLLDGTVQTAGERLRLHIGLHDVHTGELAWAHSFDRPDGDLLDIQGDVAAETVSRLDSALLLREGRRLGRLDAATLNPDESVLAALPALFSMEPSAFGLAGARLRDAIGQAPDHAAAHAWLALWHALRIEQGWTSPGTHDAATDAGRLAARAIMLDPADARVLTIAGHVRAAVERRPDEGIALHRRALALNANLGWAWMFAGLANAYQGRHDEALRMMEQAKRLSPSDPFGFLFDTALALPHLLSRDHAAAAALGRHALALNPALPATALVLLAALGHCGTAEDQAATREALLAIDPAITICSALRRLPVQVQADRAHYAAGLRRAGLPD